MDILGRHGFEVELEDTSPGRCSLAAIYMKRENILSRFWFGEKMEKIEEKILNHLVKKTNIKTHTEEEKDQRRRQNYRKNQPIITYKQT